MSEAVQTTRLFLEGFEADLSDNSNLAITYVIHDIKDIASNGSSYSKTLTLPGTVNNNYLFNYYFDIRSSGLLEVQLNPAAPNIATNYNPKKRIKATVIKDSMVVFDGYAQLVDASITNGLISYDIQLSSPLTAFAAILSGNNAITGNAYRLEDIPDSLTSGFTHTVDPITIQSTWEVPPCTTFLYPLIDYGTHDSVNTTAFYLSDMRPALYAKQYWDLIFQAAGFTYQSDFINSDYFKRLVCPFKEGNIIVDGNQSIVTTNLAESSMQTPSINTGGGGTKLYIYNDVVLDPESLYNGTLMEFIPSLSGVYSFNVNFSYYYIFTPLHTNLEITNSEQQIYVNFEVYSSGGTLVSTNTQTITVPFANFGYWEGVWDTRTNRPGPFPPNEAQISSASLSNIPVFISVGQYLKVSINAFSSTDNPDMFIVHGAGAYTSGTTELGICNGVEAPAPQMSISYTNILDYSQLTYQNFCLKNVNQIDFITSICRLFNLYVEQDESNPYQLNFFTRDEYFSDTTVLDWSNKVDYNQTISVKPLPNLQNNTFLYTYRQDSDWWNKQYTSLYGSIYGQNLLAVNYDFATTQLDVLSDSVFSPTVPVQATNARYNSESTVEILNTSLNIISVSGYNNYVTGHNQPAPSGEGFAKARQNGQILYWGNLYTIVGVINQYSIELLTPVTGRSGGAVNGTFYATNDVFTYVTNNSKTIPAIYQSSDNNVTRSPVGVNPRILFYQGYIPTPGGETWSLQSTPIQNSSNSFNYTYVGGAEVSENFTKYPCLNHLDSFTNPTIDMLFGPPLGLFFPAAYPPNLPNYFTYFWENQLNEIIDNQAKLWTGYVKLNSVDMNTLDLSNVIHIQGTNYKINQIIDYAADRSSTTQVELIRLPYQQVNSPYIIFPPTANAGANQSLQLCLGTVNVSASGSTGDPLAYLWSIVSGPAGGSFTSAGSQNTAFNFTNAGTYVLQVSVLPGGSTATTTITVNPPVANAGSDQSTALCNGHVNLSASGSTGCITGYTWSVLSGPSGSSFGSSTSQNTTFNFVNQGTYVVEVTVQPGSVTDTVNVVAVPPVANAGTDQILLFPASSTSVSASGSTGCITSYAWSQISGPNSATISSPSSMNTNVSGLITGTYVLQAEVQPGNVTDTMSIIIDSPVTLTVSGGTSLTDTITGVTVGGVSSVHTSGTNFPITGGQSGVFNAGANPFGSVSVVVSLSNAIVGEVVNVIDTAGAHQSTTISTAGAQTVPFTCSMLPGSPASVNVQPEPPTVNLSNNRPGATISSITGIAGFTSGSLSTGASISGYHTAFTGTIAVNFSVGPTSASNLYLTGAFTQTIPVAAGFTGTKTFTSQTYGTTSVIDITLAT
jgi:hypothetical protein